MAGLGLLTVSAAWPLMPDGSSTTTGGLYILQLPPAGAQKQHLLEGALSGLQCQ